MFVENDPNQLNFTLEDELFGCGTDFATVCLEQKDKMIFKEWATTQIRENPDHIASILAIENGMGFLDLAQRHGIDISPLFVSSYRLAERMTMVYAFKLLQNCILENDFLSSEEGIDELVARIQKLFRQGISFV